jgi:hypothetical protein
MLTVTSAVVTGIAISPSSTSVPQGTPVAFTATGTFSDSTTGDISRSVTWASSNTSVATIDSTGLLTTLAAGSTNISASSGGIVSNTAVVTVVSQPIAQPGAPIGVFAVSGTNQATLSWSPVTDATAYNIYWGTTPGVTSASTKVSGATSPYVHTGLSAGSTYYYRVSALNTGGETLSAETFTFVYTGGNPAGSFGATSNSMLAARGMYHTATLLPSGKVLITGGYNVTEGCISSAELYDPVTGLFSSTGSMSTARDRHAATLLPNGKVLVTGGYATATGYLASAEIYDPATGLFSNTGSMVTARYQHTATLLSSGKVLVAAGYGTDYLASAELYDPTTGLFSSTGSMVAAGTERTATLLPNGKVLITGGKNGYTVNSFLASAETYDPATGLFSSTTSNMSVARAAHTATLLPSGKILITGGITIGLSYLASSELYDPVTGLFGAVTNSMIMARGFHAATLLPNGKVLMTGGINDTGYLAGAELYDPALGSFSATGNMATARDEHIATLLPNGKVLVTAGWGGSYLSSAELFQ